MHQHIPWKNDTSTGDVLQPHKDRFTAVVANPKGCVILKVNIIGPRCRIPIATDEDFVRRFVEGQLFPQTNVLLSCLIEKQSALITVEFASARGKQTNQDERQREQRNDRRDGNRHEKNVVVSR